MSLDKKAILKEIEVLIRSIKVHYDNIENEYRIPTIELELITSKIRKLHEKSIIYNHIHYMEEEQLQTTKRLKLDHIIFKHSSELETSEKIEIKAKENQLFTNQVRFEEKIAEIEKQAEEKQEAIIAATESSIKSHLHVEESSPIIEINKEEINHNAKEEKVIENAVSTEATKVELAQNGNFKQVKLGSKIGINDRFRFIKNLFGGNGAGLEQHIHEIESCQNLAALKATISELKNKYHWNEEDENVMDFMALIGEI
jgi:hypothetical protein